MFTANFRIQVCLVVFGFLQFSRATAQEQNLFVLRIMQFEGGGRYTCTGLTLDRQLEQVTANSYQGELPPFELRRGPASDEDIKRVEELLQVPEFRRAASGTLGTPSFIVRPDGKFISVTGLLDGKPKLVQFSDPEGKLKMPAYLKPFESFANDVRRRKLPKAPRGDGTGNCKVPSHF